MRKILLAAVILSGVTPSQAQWGGCGDGFCNRLTAPVTLPTCSPGNATGQFDFSACSNLAATAAAMP